MKNKFSKISKPLLLLLTSVLLWQFGFSQTRLTTSKEKPLEARQNDWNWNESDQEIWQFRNEKWELPFPEKCTFASAYHGLILLGFGDAKTKLLKADGTLLDFVAPHPLDFFCKDSISIATKTDWRYYLDQNGKIISMVNWGECPRTIRDTIGGIECFCLPKYELGQYNAPGGCESIRGYGYLGVNGKWIIEPYMSHPFKFENGFANVVMYGRPFKINEKGEIVE